MEMLVAVVLIAGLAMLVILVKMIRIVFQQSKKALV